MARTSTSGQGRKKGVPNKATREVKDAAQQFGPAAVRKLAELGGLIDGGTGMAAGRSDSRDRGPECPRAGGHGDVVPTRRPGPGRTW